MTVADALMLALGAIALGAGTLVVTSTHLVRAGLYLVISLGAIAGLYLVLGAELVAWVQILVYVGAVVVLMLFAVMLTRAPIGPSADLDRPAGPAALIGGGVGFGLTVLLIDAFRWTAYDLPPVGSARRVGEQVFGAWVLPFEVLSILLLSALVGAIILSRPDLAARTDAVAEAPPPPPDPAAESAETIARLTRIAARQATAEQRYREAAAEKAAADRRAAPDEVEGEIVEEPGRRSTPPTPGRFGPATQSDLKRQASDVIFGARESAPKPPTTPQPPAPPEASRIIEGTLSDEPSPPSTTRPTTPSSDPELPPAPTTDPTRKALGSAEPPTNPAAPTTGRHTAGDAGDANRPAVGGRDAAGRPAVGGPDAAGRRAVGGSSAAGRPAVGGAADRPSVTGPAQRPSVASRGAQPALPPSDKSDKSEKSGGAATRSSENLPKPDNATDAANTAPEGDAGRPDAGEEA